MTASSSTRPAQIVEGVGKRWPFLFSPCCSSPGGLVFTGGLNRITDRVPFYAENGRVNLIHVFDRKRVGQVRGVLGDAALLRFVEHLYHVPAQMEQALADDSAIVRLARTFEKHGDFLYLGRGVNYPIALEGALKLKEISYIHAEGYPAGEMKHGPIALIDEDLPIVALAPDDNVFEKSLGNIQEAKARGGRIVVLTNASKVPSLEGVLDPDRDTVLTVPDVDRHLMPVVLTIPLQLLAYCVAVRRGCDVDQPRNLAKSVTVE